MRPVSLVPIFGLVALATGCGGKTPTGASGSPVSGLVITGVDAVLTGVSASYTATATLANGMTGTVTPAWSSSNPGVASVDSAGRLEGRAHGSTSLTATYEGRSVSRTVQVVNNYGGTWEGTYVVRACTDTGDLTDHDGGWCLAGSGRVGTVRNITMTLVQGGKNLNEIKRTLAGSTYPHVPDPITGVVNADGRLTLAATRWTYTDFDFPDVIIGVVQVGPMDLNLDGAGGMTGRWSEDLTSLEGRRGTAHTENELGTVTLSTGSPWDYAIAPLGAASREDPDRNRSARRQK
jgi:hypothetical protein